MVKNMYMNLPLTGRRAARTLSSQSCSILKVYRRSLETGSTWSQTCPERGIHCNDDVWSFVLDSI